jgi:uncharacterized membrane protein YgcG
MSIEAFPGQFGSDKDKDAKRKNVAPASRWEHPKVLNLTGRHEGNLVELRSQPETLPVPPPLFELVNTEQKDDKKKEEAPGYAPVTPVEAPLPLAESSPEDDEEDDTPAKPVVVPDAALPAPAPEFEDLMRQLGPEYAQATSDDTLDKLPGDEELPAPASAMPPVEAVASSSAETDDETEDAAPPPASSGTGRPPLPPPPPSRFASAANPPPPPRSFNVAPAVPTPNWNIAPMAANMANLAPMIPVAGVVEAAIAAANANRRAVRSAERRGFITGALVAGVTVYVLRGYFANRRLRRVQKTHEREIDQRDKQIDFMQSEQYKRDEQMTRLQEEQKRLRQEVLDQAQSYKYVQPKERVAGSPPAAVPFEASAASAAAEMTQAGERAAQPPGVSPAEAPVQIAPAEQLFDQQGNEITLQPGWHAERSAGGYVVVLDQHNRVVHDSVRYGKEFQREQQREQLGPTPSSAAGGGLAGGGDVSGGGGAYTSPSIPPGIVTHSPVDLSHALTGGQPQQADMQHRLPAPRHPVAAIIKSPWLWTAMAVLLIVYFIAALA